MSDGRTERLMSDGTRVTVFPSGSLRESRPDGRTTVRLANGDIKEVTCLTFIFKLCCRFLPMVAGSISTPNRKWSNVPLPMGPLFLNFQTARWKKGIMMEQRKSYSLTKPYAIYLRTARYIYASITCLIHKLTYRRSVFFPMVQSVAQTHMAKKWLITLTVFEYVCRCSEILWLKCVGSLYKGQKAKVWSGRHRANSLYGWKTWNTVPWWSNPTSTSCHQGRHLICAFSFCF